MDKEEIRRRNNIAVAKYRKTEKGKLVQKKNAEKYNNSKKCKETRQRYRDSEHGKKVIAKLNKQMLKKIYKETPERIKAKNAVIGAIRFGKMKRMPCIICGNPKTHAHHEDYSKPLDVVFLCLSHHRRRHLNNDISLKEFMIRNHV